MKEKMMAGRYLPVKELGTGGTARVFLAEDIYDGRRYALKRIPQRCPEAGGSIPAEFAMMKRLYHPVLPHIWQVWAEEGYVCVLMDYVEGTPLDKLLREQGAQPQERAVEWMKQICKAVIYLHSFQPPMIYRDMKPGNIVLQPDGSVKLIDFGAVKVLSALTGRDAIPLGTPGYAAPEQYGKRGRSNVRTDVYSLGVTMYHLVTGHNPGEPPYETWPIRKWNRGLSPELERIILKCTSKNPRRRYGDCKKLLQDLEHYQEKDAKRDGSIWKARMYKWPN